MKKLPEADIQVQPTAEQAKLPDNPLPGLLSESNEGFSIDLGNFMSNEKKPEPSPEFQERLQDLLLSKES